MFKFFKIQQDINNVSWIVIFLTMMILSLLFFLISWIANPGYLYKKPGSTLLKIIEKGNDCTGICPECEIVKPLRSRHCDVCNRCVGVYDHHCPWINNCVGMKLIIFAIFKFLNFFFKGIINIS